LTFEDLFRILQLGTICAIKKGGIMFIENLADNNVNLNNLPEDGVTPVDKNNTQPADFDLGKFFDTMERQVNGAVFDTEPAVTLGEQDPAQPQVPDQGNVSEPENVSAEVAELRKELDLLNKRYSDSSTEAIRLAKEQKEMEQYRDYVPILKTMRDDPQLINHVRDYLEGNVTPTSVKDGLNLPEDFVFDGDEAVNDPNSGSAKVLQNMIDRGVEHKLRQHTQAQRQETDQREQLRSFKEKMGMNEESYNEFENFAKNRNLTLEDIYYLKTRETREKAIAKNAIEERDKQLQKMRNQPPSMAAQGGYDEPVDENAEVFNAIAKAAKGASFFD